MLSFNDGPFSDPRPGASLETHPAPRLFQGKAACINYAGWLALSSRM